MPIIGVVGSSNCIGVVCLVNESVPASNCSRICREGRQLRRVAGCSVTKFAYSPQLEPSPLLAGTRCDLRQHKE